MPASRLTTYQAKRDFRITPEPRGGPLRREGRSFCVQKHAARRLHYDFRLEMDGVLKSWAVPKGPSLDPGDKRLAMETEDHPVEYGAFEGIIPAGQYGGGTVLLWDRGTWEPREDPEQGYRTGVLKFRLNGEKLQGGWTLVRIRGRERDPDKKTWLLVKERDAAARPGSASSLVEARPESVVSGRSLDQIAADRDAVWNSRRPGDGDAARAPKPAAVAPVSPPAGARRAALPRLVRPQLATLVAEAPGGPDWLHEMKLDGYRILARLQGGRARLWTRTGSDWTAHFPAVEAAVSSLPATEALVDGEVAMLQATGTTSFQALQNFMTGTATGTLIYYVFDLVHLDGHDLSSLPLETRKDVLRRLVAGAGDPIRYSDHVIGTGPEVFRQACRLGLEGIVSKRRGAPYQPGRSRGWLKVKCVHEQEVVIGGYTDPAGSRSGLGALLVGVYDRDGALRYVGKVGTGFTASSLRDLHRRLGPLGQPGSPFADRVPDPGRAHWVVPRLVGVVAFTEWTGEGRMRHPSFKGLREDKPARDVVREVPQIEPPAQETVASRRLGAGQPLGGSTRSRSRSRPLPETGRRVRRTIRRGGRSA